MEDKKEAIANSVLSFELIKGESYITTKATSKCAYPWQWAPTKATAVSAEEEVESINKSVVLECYVETCIKARQKGQIYDCYAAKSTLYEGGNAAGYMYMTQSTTLPWTTEAAQVTDSLEQRMLMLGAQTDIATVLCDKSWTVDSSRTTWTSSASASCNEHFSFDVPGNFTMSKQNKSDH